MPSYLVKRPPYDARSRWYARVNGPATKGSAAVFGVIIGGAAVGVTVAANTVAREIVYAVGTVAVIGYLLTRPVLSWALRPRTEFEREITDEFGRVDLDRARQAVDRIEGAWPHLHGLVDEPAGPTLDQALWQLAGDLLRRAEVRAAGVDIEQVITELPVGDPAVAALTAQADDLAAVYRRLDESVTGQIDLLDRLADECQRHLIAQAAQARVEAVTRRADALLGSGRLEPGTAPDTDPATELAERTAAVLGAYRELRAITPS